MNSKNMQIIRSSRKTAAIEIKLDMRVLVRVPYRMKQADIERFINEKADWIEKHLKIMQARIENAQRELPVVPFSVSEIEELCTQALKKLVPHIAELAEIVGVSYGRITIRNQVSRWGSCTADGNLNFNCLLTLFPDEVADYVIIHELCHRRYMNHSKEFWAEVEKFCPDFKAQKKWLRDNGNEYIKRMRAAR